MQPSDKNLKELKALLDEAEEKVAAAKRILFEQVYQEQAKNLDINAAGSAGPNTIVEGVFDGEEMIDGSGKKFPVPSNYASKSKLIPGDKLKLTITADGTFIFKQIGPVDRKRMVGTLSEVGDRWLVNCDGKKYNCLSASVTYFHAKSGDEVTIIVPKVGESDWAALENCLNKGE
jgi:hypothetical protein